MKKFFRFAFLPVVALMAVAMVACEPDNPEPGTKVETILKLTSDSGVTFPAEGGEGVITFILENTVEGTELTAGCEADWVSNITVGENITFTVSANDGEERQTKVVVEYGELGFEVNVRQHSKDSDKAFIVTVSEIATTSAFISVEAKDYTMSYYFDVIPEEDYIEKDGDVGSFFEDIVAYYQEIYPTIDLVAFLPNLLSTNNDSDSVTGLEPGTTYYAYAVEVDPTTGEAGENWTVEKFTTKEPGDPSKCSFEIAITRLYSTDVEFTITPSDESVAYWYAVTAVDSYPGDVPMQAEVKAGIEAAAVEYNLSVEDAVARLIVRGAIEDTWFELEKSTSYYLYVYAMDKQGNAAGPMYKETFTTKEQDISDADIALTYRVFDGDELYASDSEKFEMGKGKAVVQCEATPNDTAYYWLIQLAGGDLSDTTIYPDDATINAMLEAGGTFNKLCTHYYMDWGATATLLGFATDYTMMYGVLHRELIVPSKDQCVSIDEYRENATAEPMSVLSVEPKAKSAMDVKSQKKINAPVKPYRESRGNR